MAVMPGGRSVPTAPPTPTMFQLKREKEANPFVRQALDLFDAEVVRVELPRSAPGGAPPAGTKSTGLPTTGLGSDAEDV
jgi:hypothetical protein